MALSPVFESYLAHFGETVPVKALHEQPARPGLCALRHDVDHDLDVALEVAHWEYKLGARATYFVLPTASYWEDPRLIDKCLQFQDYGHEVGLHVNCMAQWAVGESDDPERTLREQLARLREGGVEVKGISAHGDRLCYEFNVSNYWCFQELRPADPHRFENSRTAEGVYDPAGERRLAYPSHHVTERGDGTRFPLWSISMSSLGLSYHAWHTPFDRYFSDSGGSWKRTPDPMEYARKQERWQVLIHPIYWRGPRRIYFFLSTARSGSRWLSQVLDEGTRLQARHEYILNQEYHRGESGYKATADMRRLENEPEEVGARLAEAWEELGELKNDYAEVNVYLESFLGELRRYFPNATFVHLHRNPKDVVRSLMDRDWYDTPEDPNHPRLRELDGRELTRFGRVCEYVAEANNRLVQECEHRISLEELTSDPEGLEQALGKLGIAYHPRLGRTAATQIINATREPVFPTAGDWTAELTSTFDALYGRCLAELDYGGGQCEPLWTPDALQRDRVRRNSRRDEMPQFIASGPGERENARARGVYCDLSEDEKTHGILVRLKNVERNAYMTLGGSDWHTAKPKSGTNSLQRLNIVANQHQGWPIRPGYYVRGVVSAEVRNKGSVTIFSINYNRDGEAIYRRRLGVLDPHHPRLEFAFDPHPDATTFDIALYMAMSQRPDSVVLNEWLLEDKAH